MQKVRIRKWWLWGLVALVPAGILIPSSALALADHLGKVTDDARYAFGDDRYAQTMVALIVLGALSAIGGFAAGLVAWVGAVRNTQHLPDQRWYRTLRWCGIGGLVTVPLVGVGALILGAATMAYVVGGPDALAVDPWPRIWSKSTITRWSGRGWVAAAAGGSFALLIANLTNAGRPLHGILWPSLALESFGITTAVTGGLIVATAWWAALFNSHDLADKVWFKRLLWGGIVGTVLMPIFGLGAVIVAVVMIAYWHAAPDGATGVPQPHDPAPAMP